MREMYIAMFAVGLASACSSGDATKAGSAPSADAGTGEVDAGGAVEEGGASPSSATTDGTCNALAQIGEEFGAYETQASRPAAKGGLIEDGIYVATRATYFDSTGREGRRVGRGHATTMEIVGRQVHTVTVGDTPEDLRRWSGVIEMVGTDLDMDAQCFHPADPAATGPSGGRAPYTFENGTLRMYSPAGVNPPQEITYVKRN